MPSQLTLLDLDGQQGPKPAAADFEEVLARFREFGTRTRRLETAVAGASDEFRDLVPTYVNEFWTAKQRAASSLHEISYRACFKPQLPRFFIRRLTRPGDVVYDPFMGRGTTPLEAGLLGRAPWGCDANPLSRMLVEPRLAPPRLSAVGDRLRSIDFDWTGDLPEDLLVFYHPDTLRAIVALREHLVDREKAGDLDGVDRWIRMVAANRLTGHSSGFLSVYTLPPNQAVSVKSQAKINAERGQTPPKRSVVASILRKSTSLLADCTAETRMALSRVLGRVRLFTGSSAETPELPSESVQLVVTSPPFLDVVDYLGDNWLRCWFCSVDLTRIRLTVTRKLTEWEREMTRTLCELERVLVPGGEVAFEVGEIRSGRLRLEENIVRCARAANLRPRLIVINAQHFTKTSNAWGISNLTKGTNTNRVVILRKPG